MLGRCDDSSGLIGDRFRRAIGQLGRIIEAAQPNPATLAEQVFEAFCDNGYGVFDGVIQQLKQALGPEGLKSLKSRFEQWAEQPVPLPPRQEWQQVGWSSGGPSYAHEQAELAPVDREAGPSGGGHGDDEAEAAPVQSPTECSQSPSESPSGGVDGRVKMCWIMWKWSSKKASSWELASERGSQKACSAPLPPCTGGRGPGLS